jgi:hypothetical protein
LILVNKALAIEETEYSRFTKRAVLNKLGKKRSKKEIEAALIYIKNHPTYSENDKKISTAEWMKLLKEN